MQRMMTVFYDEFNTEVRIKYNDKILMLKEGYDLKFANDLLDEVQSFKSLIEKKYRAKSVK